MSMALCTVAHERAQTPSDGGSAAKLTSALREKVQQQALQLHSYEAQVAWSSKVAQTCLDHLQRLDPSMDVTKFIRVHEVSFPSSKPTSRLWFHVFIICAHLTFVPFQGQGTSGPSQLVRTLSKKRTKEAYQGMSPHMISTLAKHSQQIKSLMYENNKVRGSCTKPSSAP
jgi:hypothetical protein